VIITQIDELIRELRRSMNYLQTQTQAADAARSTEIDGMYLCGGGAMLKGLDQYIQAKLGIPVTTIGVFDNPIVTQFGGIAGSGVDLAVATGLAMRPMLAAA
jgi:Tfp pilus assembly PilM family ATPase